MTTTTPEMITPVDYFSDLYEKYLPENCGIPSSSFIIGDKILNGEVSKMTDHNWMVALMYYNDKDSRSLEALCGGAVINERFILTAAHCLRPTRPDFVRIGEFKLSSDPDCEVFKGETICNPKAQDMKIHKNWTHPSYSHATKKNDIALLRVQNRIKFNNDQSINRPLVYPICLPPLSSSDTEPAEDAAKYFEVVGWGEH